MLGALCMSADRKEPWMQPGEEIESLVDELEQMITEARSPLTGGGAKKIVDAQDVYEILDEFGETTTGQWVNEHCHEYGFIRRYQLEYAYETGYGQEAWHYRYVGVELATYLYENDMSLEAYYGVAQVVPWDE